eukprot:c46279_g1_i1 orf=139-345(+)
MLQTSHVQEDLCIHYQTFSIFYFSTTNYFVDENYPKHPKLLLANKKRPCSTDTPSHILMVIKLQEWTC